MYKGYIFVCTGHSVAECIKNRVLTCSAKQLPIAKEIEEGSVVFLLNVETNALVGPFTAAEGAKAGLEQGTWGSSIDKKSLSGNIKVEWEALHKLVDASNKIPFLENMKTCALSHFQTQELLAAFKEAPQFSTNE